MTPGTRLEGKEYLAHGKRGIAYTARLAGRKVLVKERNPRAALDTIPGEARMLALANAHGIGPALIGMSGGAMVREFVDGEEILDWMGTASRGEIARALLAVLRECRTLDAIGLEKGEMTHPYKHILVRAGVPVQIDFERARRSLRPRNVTQCCQWLCSGRMREALEARGMAIGHALLRDLARAYKEGYSDEEFARLEAAVEEALA